MLARNKKIKSKAISLLFICETKEIKICIYYFQKTLDKSTSLWYNADNQKERAKKSKLKIELKKRNQKLKLKFGVDK